MMIIQLMEGNLRYTLSNNFNDILWENKILWLYYIAWDLCNLHDLGYCHKDFHSGNILNGIVFQILGLSRSSNVWQAGLD